MKQFSLPLMLAFFLTVNLHAQTALESGDIAYGARNFKQAISYYERAINEGNQQTDLLLKLAHSYRFVNDMQNAEKLYASACKNTAVSPINHYYYGTVLKANQKYEASKSAFASFGYSNPVLAEMASASCDFALRNKTMSVPYNIVSENAVSSQIYDDYAPVLHRNGLIFTSARQTKHDALPGGFSNPSTQNFLYRASINEDGSLSKAAVIKNNVAVMPTTNIAPFAITESENFAVSTYNEFSNGIRHTHSASLSRLSMEMHLRMEKIEDFVPGDEFPHILQQAASFPAFANKDQSIYFAMYGYEGGYGGFDLWVIHQQNGQWSKPINLGPKVNSPGDEICPMLDKDGRLFFASDFHKGFGGFDVFTATAQGNQWQQIRNMGAGINSAFDDMYFVYDSDNRRGYFSSNRNRYYNLYRASFSGAIDLLPLVEPSETEPIVLNTASDTTTATIAANTNNTDSLSATGLANINSTNEIEDKPIANSPTNPAVEADKTTPSISEPVVAVDKTPPANAAVVDNNDYIDNGLMAARGLPDTLRKPTVGNGNTVPCAMNFYIGGIVDATTNRPVSGAFVYIKNIKTGQESKIKDPTNQYGEYSVILDPLSDYTIAVSKAGFKNLVFDVNTGTGGKKTLLGTRSMSASATLARDKYNNILEPDGPQINTNPSANELNNPVVSSSKKFSHESNGMEVPEKGYMIQLIVAANLSKEEQLRIGQYGHIYKEPRGNKTAWRVGVYIDAEHLAQNMKELKEQYPDAFKVAVELDNKHLGGRIALSSQVIYPLNPTKIPELDDSKNDNSASTNQPLPDGTSARGVKAETADLVAFKVQLGAYQQADEISFSNIAHLGTIEKEKKANGLTYFYLSTFKSIKEARTARTEAIEEGIIAPFIVAFKNGSQVNLSEVLDTKD